MPRANQELTSFSLGTGSGRPPGALVTTFSRSEKSIRNCPAIGSGSLPSLGEGPSTLGCGRGCSFQERLFQSRRLLPHRIEGLANHVGAHTHRAQISNLLDFEQIGERVRLGGSDKATPLPVRQLARREVQNPD